MISYPQKEIETPTWPKSVKFLKIKMTNNLSFFRDSFYSEEIEVKSIPYRLQKHTEIFVGFYFIFENVVLKVLKVFTHSKTSQNYTVN